MRLHKSGVAGFLVDFWSSNWRPSAPACGLIFWFVSWQVFYFLFCFVDWGKEEEWFLFILEFFCGVWQCCRAVSWREGWTGDDVSAILFSWSVAWASSAREVAHAALFLCRGLTSGFFLNFSFQWSDCWLDLDLGCCWWMLEAWINSCGF